MLRVSFSAIQRTDPFIWHLNKSYKHFVHNRHRVICLCHKQIVAFTPHKQFTVIYYEANGIEKKQQQKIDVTVCNVNVSLKIITMKTHCGWTILFRRCIAFAVKKKMQPFVISEFLIILSLYSSTLSLSLHNNNSATADFHSTNICGLKNQTSYTALGKSHCRFRLVWSIHRNNSQFHCIRKIDFF